MFLSCFFLNRGLIKIKSDSSTVLDLKRLTEILGKILIPEKCNQYIKIFAGLGKLLYKKVTHYCYHFFFSEK